MNKALAKVTENKRANGDDDDDENKRKGILGFLPNIFGPSDAAKAMMAVFDTSDGRVQDLTKKLFLKASEKKYLLNMWLEIDGDRNNKMDYFEFISYFNLSDDVWSSRTFSIMNYNATGVVSFVEFLTFCYRFLVIDKDSTIEFAFRMLSRRGDAFNRAHHSIIDMNDMKHFISSRYPIKSLNKIKKKASDILKAMRPGDDCAEVDNFQHYTMKNPVFVKFMHPMQMHLRKCIFGMEFWATKSRKIKLSIGSALDNLLFFNSVNSVSEKFCAFNLNQPVLKLTLEQGGGPDPDAHLKDGYLETRKTKTFFGRLSMGTQPLGDYNSDFSDITLSKLTRRPFDSGPSLDSIVGEKAEQEDGDGEKSVSSGTSAVVDTKSNHSKSHAGSRHKDENKTALIELRQKIVNLSVDPSGPGYEEKVCDEYIGNYVASASAESFSNPRTRYLIATVTEDYREN